MLHHSRIPLALLSLLIAAALSGCKDEQAKVEEIRPVRTEVVKFASVADDASYSGEVKARQETRLGFRVPGKIIDRLVDVGATVKTGQALARIDSRDLQLNADARKAALTAAEADYQLANDDLRRYKDLLDKKFISQAEYDRRATAQRTAAARLDQARAGYQDGVNQASYAVLQATTDGVITAIDAEAGQVVGAGQTVMRMARPEEKEVVISLPENRVAELKAAKDLKISLWVRPNELLDGRVREISPDADAVTRTYTAKVSVLNPPADMRLGMTAQLQVHGKASRNLSLLPMTAIYQTGDKPSVWIVDGDRVKRVPVVVDGFQDNRVRVVSGIQDGQRVVTAGTTRLIEGQKVKLLDAVASGK